MSETNAVETAAPVVAAEATPVVAAPKAKTPPTPKAKPAPKAKATAKPAPKAKVEKADPKAKGGKKAAAPKAKVKKASGEAPKADRSMADVPVATRRAALLAWLKKVGAKTVASAKPVSEIADALGYNRYDVYCLVYHKYFLFTEGYVKTEKVENANGRQELGAYLTAKGLKGLEAE